MPRVKEGKSLPEEVTIQFRIVEMSHCGFHDFMQRTDGPGVPVPEIAELVRRSAPWDASCTTSKL
ncbi:hypothetical protein MesoLjLc_18730 [Mesorhizobium sp. L-8-10]|nr:hypothetical protein MesoLjLc_18730 [Mesorhizobium sp. L-8-10]